MISLASPFVVAVSHPPGAILDVAVDLFNYSVRIFPISGRVTIAAAGWITRLAALIL